MSTRDAALETGVLYCDDNLVRMATLPSESVDLVYLDPPFFSNRIYEVIWGDEAEVRSFEDRWEGGIQVYVNWMRDRVLEMHRLLKPTGSLYLHCDPHASHYLKVMLDSIFGIERFRSDVTWLRTTTHNDAKRWSPNSDNILYYSKGPKPTWNPMYVPYSEEYLTSKYRYVDADGRRYMLDNMTSPNPRPNLMYEWKGHQAPAKGWRYSRARMAELDAVGLIWYPDRKSKRPRLKRYLDEQSGVTVGDVWTDIPPINSRAAERLGYPTQKPLALLERIITASSNPLDVVLDPFCGCGTTIDAALRLDRQWVGIDISPTAANIIDRRLKRIAGAVWPKLVGLPSTVESLRQLRPFEFQNWVIQQFYGVASARRSGDMGIDGYTFMTHDPIQVKRSDRVGRNVVDNFETAVKRDGKNVGWIVAFSFTKDAREEVARARWHAGIDIKLVTVEQMLRPKTQRRGPFWPEPATVAELPVNPPRDVSKMTADQLVASDLADTAV